MKHVSDEAQLDHHLELFYQQVNPVIKRAETQTSEETVQAIEAADYPDIQETFLQEEEAIRLALEKFENKMSICKIHEDVPPSKRTVLKAKINYLRSIREKLLDESTGLLAKARIRSFTKFLWQAIKTLNEISSLPHDDPLVVQTMTRMRDKVLKWALTTFEKSMKTSDFSLKGEVVTAFTAFKEAYKTTFSEVLLKSQESRARDYYEAHNPKVQTSMGAPTVLTNAAQNILKKKKGKLSLRIGLSSIYVADHTSAVKLATGSVFAAISLPAMLLSFKGLLSTHKAHRQAAQYLEECKGLKAGADRMVFEGEAMLRAGEGNLSPEMMEKGHKMISVGIEVRERMRMNIENLTKEIQGYESTMLYGGLSIPGMLAGSTSKIGKTLETLLHGSKTAIKGFSYVGIAGGVAGVLIGGALSVKAINGISKTNSQIDAIALKRQSLLKLKTNAFRELESSRLDQTETLLKSQIRAEYLTLASSLLITAVGIIALFALINPGWTSDLSLSLLAISGAISIANYYYKKHLPKIKAPPNITAVMKEIRALKEDSEEIKSLCKYLKIDDIRAFHHNPEVFLTPHFRS
ncbi:MAG: hypothetical protein SP1CHLAM54_06700 [Chlamydiia bacterium]|nr:hypothetical protein [Chlamydiia bacterium]MCH9615579.1 hypothetical protein [Chlamydiia bacterium]MCH9629234.1 hypothetical protein [Chlamydiia bacterium]